MLWRQVCSPESISCAFALEVFDARHPQSGKRAPECFLVFVCAVPVLSAHFLSKMRCPVALDCSLRVIQRVHEGGVSQPLQTVQLEEEPH